jgi:hypothetical protein
LLGWAFAQQGEKSPPFAEAFTALGVVFDVSKMEMSLATVANKPARIESICADVEEIRQKRMMSKAEKDSLRGRLQFLERHVFGRTGKFLINELCGMDGYAGGNVGWSQLKDQAAQCLIHWMRRLSPRSITPAESTKPVVIFTDGAEGDLHGVYAACGAVLVDPNTERREFFGTAIPQSLVDEWRMSGVQKIIAQAELLPVLLSLVRWKEIIRNKRALIFVDNESAKYACINMWTPVTASQVMLKLIAEWNLDVQSWIWYSRVASFSNPADPASRLEFEEVKSRFGAKQVQCDVPTSLLNSKVQGGELVLVT